MTTIQAAALAPYPRERRRRFLLALGICAAVFSVVLIRLGELALSSELNSHVLLIPCISGYLIWTRRKSLFDSPGYILGARSADLQSAAATNGTRASGESYRARVGDALRIENPRSGYEQIPAASRPDLLLTAVFATLGVLAGIGYLFSYPLHGRDALSLGVLSFVCFVVALVPWMFGRATLKSLAFPLGFLIFMVPLPTVAVDGLETFLQHASAEAASWMYPLTGIPVLRDGLVFTLPNITLRVAQECSGIRSSMVLFITSLLAGHLFLRHRGYQAVLALATIVLGILRNAFRVLVLSWLCVNISPDMIDSSIHHHGGPIFFALSLVPLFGLLLLFRRLERGAAEKAKTQAS